MSLRLPNSPRSPLLGQFTEKELIEATRELADPVKATALDQMMRCMEELVDNMDQLTPEMGLIPKFGTAYIGEGGQELMTKLLEFLSRGGKAYGSLLPRFRPIRADTNYPLRLLFAARHEFEYMFGIIDNGIVHQLHPCLDQDNRSDIHSVWVGIPEDEHIYWCCLVVFDTSITL